MLLFLLIDDNVGLSDVDNVVGESVLKGVNVLIVGFNDGLLVGKAVRNFVG